MGIIGDFIGGAADAGAGLVGNQIKLDQQLDYQTKIQQQQAALEMERQKALAQFQIDQQNAQRTAMTGRMNAQLDTDANVNSTTPAAPLPTNDQGVPVQADGTPMPQEAIDSYNNASGILNKQRASFKADPKNMLRAQVETGDAKASDLASMDNKAEMNQLKYEMLRDMRAATNDSKENIAAAEINAGKYDKSGRSGGASKDPASRVARTIQKNDGSYVAVMADGSIKDLGIKSGALEKTAANLAAKRADSDPQFAKLPQAQQLEQIRSQLINAATPTSSQETAASVATPQGMKLIGHTKDGKAVYEDANGKRYTQ
jgi:hypothetical protein